ncbi:MAG: RelA/SpoT domain-containing protein [Solirubrobacteraceae bacterium]|nr:RelA/SpoT domain-containing protein [Solirubrobacteraceae bacterium]
MSSPLPLSRTQIEKLGKRLVAGDRPDPDDLLLLNELQLAYREVLATTVERVAAVVPYKPTSRVKTQSTTLDKLRLNGGSWLSSIQDLGGMRLVGSFDRNGQDAVVGAIVDVFADADRAPKVVDRRERPSSGYRAVHVVVFPERVPIEVQVRTALQHEWADLFEKLADFVGRGIRYGEPPEPFWRSIDDVVAAYPSVSGVDVQAEARRLWDVVEASRRTLVGFADTAATLIDRYELLHAKAPLVAQEHRKGVNESVAALRDAINRQVDLQSTIGIRPSSDG